MNVFEKIIKKLEKYKDTHLTEHNLEQCLHCQEIDCDMPKDCTHCVMDKAKEIINQAAEEYNNGWIPLSSGKRPKDNQFILFTVKLERGGNLETFYNTKYGFYKEDADSFVISDGSVDSMPFGEVTAWQPLPESYKSKGE